MERVTKECVFNEIPDVRQNKWGKIVQLGRKVEMVET